MSTLYNVEPQPTAKVLLQTTAGDVIFELFAKQTPLASRNFLQHCLDGYYTNTLFHRLVPGFILQGGDPTGTGAGGQSAFDGGEPFADEFHSRLKFNRRGLLGMANAGKDDNGSQFFVTLGAARELDGRNTMFGRVEGDTIFNVLKMAEGDLAEEGGDRPMYPYRVTGSEVLVNPFEDMVKTVPVVARKQEEKKEKRKTKRKAGGKGLLSFGGDEEGDGDEAAAPMVKKAKFNPKLVDAGDAKPQVSAKKEASGVEKAKGTPTTTKKPVGGTIAKEPERSSPENTIAKIARTSDRTNGNFHREKRSETTTSEESASSSPPPPNTASLIDRTNAQIAELKASMRRNVAVDIPAQTRPKSVFEAMIPATAKRGRKRRPGGGDARDEQRALDLFTAFRSKLNDAAPEPHNSKHGRFTDRIGDGDDTAPARSEKGSATQAIGSGNRAAKNDDQDEEAALCDLHFIANCQSCSKWDEHHDATHDSDDQGAGWMSHALSFAKDRLGKDLEWKRKNEHELVVIDPREKTKELRGERKKGRDKAGGGEGGKGKEKGRR